MADILSAGSSQKFLATLVDLNNIPVAASAIHVEGYFYTSANSVFKFEVNKGATKGCTIINDMLAFNLDPKLLPGNIRVRTIVHTGTDTDTMGLTDAENDQPIDVTIVKSGTYVGARQGAFGVIIKLNTLITDKDQLPWSLPGKSVQAIKDEMMKVMKSPEFVQIRDRCKDIGSENCEEVTRM